MKKQFSNEDVDLLLTELMRTSEIDSQKVDEIADSPRLWWSVQTNIKREKEVSVSPWPPVEKIWRWLAIAAPVAAGLVIAAIWFVGGSQIDQPVAFNDAPLVVSEAPDGDRTSFPDQSSKDVIKSEAAAVNVDQKIPRARKSVPKTAAKLATRKPVEIKTDFIALTYAQAPASGQIVRVQVPSSMMVSLGLVETVERPTRLVDAEVVLGDDGMTHAIRFIRNQ